MNTEKRLISEWKRAPKGVKMNQVVYITTKGGKVTSETRHEASSKYAAENK